MLAISLHAVRDELRDELVPINRKYDIAQLLDACRAYPGLSNARRITFEYVMLKGVNDSDADARELVRLLKGIPAKINLIPFNPWPGSKYECSDWERIERFSEIVYRAGYASPVRTPRGRDILAACGQLKSETEKLRARARMMQESGIAARRGCTRSATATHEVARPPDRRTRSRFSSRSARAASSSYRVGRRSGDGAAHGQYAVRGLLVADGRGLCRRRPRLSWSRERWRHRQDAVHLPDPAAAFVALVGEVAGLRRLAWYAGATGLLTAVIPWLLRGSARVASPAELHVGFVLALTGAVAGLFYWMVAGRSAGRRAPSPPLGAQVWSVNGTRAPAIPSAPKPPGS